MDFQKICDDFLFFKTRDVLEEKEKMKIITEICWLADKTNTDGVLVGNLKKIPDIELIKTLHAAQITFAIKYFSEVSFYPKSGEEFITFI